MQRNREQQSTENRFVSFLNPVDSEKANRGHHVTSNADRYYGHPDIVGHQSPERVARQMDRPVACQNAQNIPDRQAWAFVGNDCCRSL